ncbi:MAG: type III pantothenate kinase [Ignavibacteriae bacterium]|nr:type III pantothenate kinase [Ignavibacteriota bacterium]
MSTRRIVVVAGNTRTRVALLQGLDVEMECGPIPTRLLTETSLQESLNAIRGHGARDVVLCSVVPAADEHIKAYCAHQGFSCTKVRSSDVRGMVIRYEPPDGLGADRLCGLLGLRVRYGSPSMFIDCGTATTVNILDARGDFGGGCIFPGVAASLRALHTDTALLPALEPEAGTPEFPAFSTRDSLRAGAYWSAAWALEGMIRHARERHGEAVRVVLTGGGASALRPALRAAIIEDQQLLFIGAAVFCGA